MSEGIQNLNENLKRQIDLYKQIYVLEQSKKEALTQNNIQEIELITKQQEPLLQAAGRLESERLSWVENIGRELGKAPADLTLTELAKDFPVLAEVRLDLGRVVKQLQEIHGLNTMLLEQAVRIVNFTIGLLTYEASHTYGPPDQKDNDEDRKKHLMDWRA